MEQFIVSHFIKSYLMWYYSEHKYRIPGWSVFNGTALFLCYSVFLFFYPICSPEFGWIFPMPKSFQAANIVITMSSVPITLLLFDSPRRISIPTLIFLVMPYFRIMPVSLFRLALVLRCFSSIFEVFFFLYYQCSPFSLHLFSWRISVLLFYLCYYFMYIWHICVVNSFVFNFRIFLQWTTGVASIFFLECIIFCILRCLPSPSHHVHY